MHSGHASVTIYPMLAKVCSAAVNGIEAYPIEVEVNAGYGDTIIVIVVNNCRKDFWADFKKVFAQTTLATRI